jgi:hypothetical protein
MAAAFAAWAGLAERKREAAHLGASMRAGRQRALLSAALQAWQAHAQDAYARHSAADSLGRAAVQRLQRHALTTGFEVPAALLSPLPLAASSNTQRHCRSVSRRDGLNAVGHGAEQAWAEAVAVRRAGRAQLEAFAAGQLLAKAAVRPSCHAALLSRPVALQLAVLEAWRQQVQVTAL